jgi:hypothetical protein
MPIDRPAALRRREFMLGAGASLLAACGVMREIHGTETLMAAPRDAEVRAVVSALIPTVLPFEHPRFPALPASELERALFDMFPIDTDPNLADVRSALMLFENCALYDSPPAPFREGEDDTALARDHAQFTRYANRYGTAHFTQQAVPARRAYFKLWGDSALAVRRRLYGGFRAWVMISAYSRPALWAVIGYDGPLLERS